jgi:hypothetical protein
MNQRSFSWRIKTHERRMLVARVDLPLPVRPIKPTRSPAFKVKEIPWSAGGSSGESFTTRFSTLRRFSFLALESQYAGRRLDSITAGGSCGSLRYSMTCSTDLKCNGVSDWLVSQNGVVGDLGRAVGVGES